MAEPALIPQPMTFEAAARLDPDEFAGDIDRGEWVPVSKNTWRHGEIVGNAYVLLREFARRHGGWLVSVGDPGAKLAHDPDTLRGADVALIRAERKPTGRGVEGWLEGAPDLAVEVVGDGQTSTQVAKKGLDYLRAGGRMVWVLDPDARLVMVLGEDRQLRILGSEEMLDGGDVLPGFSCKVSEFFE